MNIRKRKKKTPIEQLEYRVCELEQRLGLIGNALQEHKVKIQDNRERSKLSHDYLTSIPSFFDWYKAEQLIKEVEQ